MELAQDRAELWDSVLAVSNLGWLVNLLVD